MQRPERVRRKQQFTHGQRANADQGCYIEPSVGCGGKTALPPTPHQPHTHRTPRPACAMHTTPRWHRESQPSTRGPTAFITDLMYACVWLRLILTPFFCIGKYMSLLCVYVLGLTCFLRLTAYNSDAVFASGNARRFCFGFCRILYSTRRFPIIFLRRKMKAVFASESDARGGPIRGIPIGKPYIKRCAWHARRRTFLCRNPTQKTYSESDVVSPENEAETTCSFRCKNGIGIRRSQTQTAAKAQGGFTQRRHAVRI